MSSKEKKDRAPFFTYEDTCRRESYRVAPLEDAPVTVQLGGEEIPLLNISAGGFACRCDRLNVGQTVPIRLCLPGTVESIIGQAVVLDMDLRGVCHASFEGLSASMKEAIHQYVLAVQKVWLERQKHKGE